MFKKLVIITALIGIISSLFIPSIVYAADPTVVTLVATSPTTSSVTLNGNLTGLGGNTLVFVSFYYGLTSSYGSQTNLQYETAISPFNTTIVSGLSPNTTYHYCAIASADATTWTSGADMTFVTGTSAAPTFATLAATSVTNSSVVLNGDLKNMGGNGLVGVSYFYGTTTSYGNQSNILYESQAQPFPISITSGLLPNTTYHFCAAVSIDNGATWTNGSDKTFKTLLSMASSTTVLINNVGLFPNYITQGDLLIGVEVFCAYTGLYPTAPPSTNFLVELLDPTDTTVIAQTPLLQWGDRPESIYLNPTAAANLIPDGAYHIQVVGTFAGATNPYVDYTIQPADWNQTLPQWCINVGNNMNIIDTNLFNIAPNSYIIPSTVQGGYGNVITTADDGFFTLAFPSIMTQYPNLFQQGSTSAIVPFPAAKDNFDSSHVWTAEMGPEISSDFTTFGAIAGVNGRTAMEYGIALIIVIMCIIGIAMGGKGLVLLVLSYPLVIWGTQAGALSISWLIVPCVAMVMLFARQFWLKPT
jgi:hypothetical protein